MIGKNRSGIILANLIVINDMVTDDRALAFEWSGWMRSYELLLDDDPDFGSPRSYDVSGNRHKLEKELDFGTYWWKVRSGEMESRAMKFTLVSTVALSRLERDMIKNSGNAELLVHRSRLAGAVTLPVNQTLEIGEEEDVKAEQK